MGGYTKQFLESYCHLLSPLLYTKKCEASFAFPLSSLKPKWEANFVDNSAMGGKKQPVKLGATHPLELFGNYTKSESFEVNKNCKNLQHWSWPFAVNFQRKSDLKNPSQVTALHWKSRPFIITSYHQLDLGSARLLRIMQGDFSRDWSSVIRGSLGYTVYTSGLRICSRHKSDFIIIRSLGELYQSMIIWLGPHISTLRQLHLLKQHLASKNSSPLGCHNSASRSLGRRSNALEVSKHFCLRVWKSHYPQLNRRKLDDWWIFHINKQHRIL